MNKAQKIIILFFLLVLLFSVLYPPFFVERKTLNVTAVIGTGWDWIFNLKSRFERKDKIYWTDYKKIRFDILSCEILAIGILAGFFIVLAKKIEKREEEKDG